MKKTNAKKGFTLMELLIVVAIIAVLVAIAIPIFNGQLEKSREATDAANIRSAYAEVVAAELSDADTDASATVELVQTQEGWQNTSIEDIAGVATSKISVKKGGKVVVKYTAKDGKLTIADQEVTASFLDSSSSSGSDDSKTEQ